MSNDNTNELYFSARNSSIGTFHIGKYSQPVTLPKIASVNSHFWKKSASFNTLQNSVYSFFGVYTVSDLISLVSDDFPLNSGTDFQEAYIAANLITDKAIIVTNLEPS